MSLIRLPASLELPLSSIPVLIGSDQLNNIPPYYDSVFIDRLKQYFLRVMVFVQGGWADTWINGPRFLPVPNRVALMHNTFTTFSLLKRLFSIIDNVIMQTLGRD